MSRRVKQSNTLQYFAIAALLFMGIFEMCSQNKLEGVVDTNYKNATTIIELKETDDCSVRAISEAYDIPYRQAHAILKSWGRINRDGILWTKVQVGIDLDFPFTASKLYLMEQYTNSFSFVERVAVDGWVYIIIAPKHMFVIEQGEHCQWLVKGNLDDAPKPIIGYLKIKL